MATIFFAASTIERKGLKPSYVIVKQVKDQIEKVNKDAISMKQTSNLT